jgi:hypothetical protein
MIVAIVSFQMSKATTPEDADRKNDAGFSARG